MNKMKTFKKEKKINDHELIRKDRNNKSRRVAFYIRKEFAAETHPFIGYSNIIKVLGVLTRD